MNMDTNLIREIASQIINEQIFQNWKFYSLTFAIAFVSAGMGSFIISYFKKRGENLATHSDLELIVDQLKQITQTTEAVKSEISQAEWKKKELNPLCQ
jgi:uncharacterized membrane protein YraQ (UPF0718 family)